MDKLRVGVVGVGYLGKFHAQKYAGMENVDLVGVVDADQTLAREIAGGLGAEAHAHHRDLIGKVDAVSVVVPTPAHFSVSRDFLENNVHLLIEKPITTTVEEADELIRMAEERRLIIQVGHLERFNPALKTVQHAVKKPVLMEARRLSVYQERGTEVSVVLDLMIHDIDICLHLAGSGIRSIHAAGISVVSGRIDMANARLEFQNGCVANLTASRIAAEPRRELRLYQEDACIHVDFGGHGASLARRNGSPPEKSRKESRKDAPIPGMDFQRFSPGKGDALLEEALSFVHAVRVGEAPVVTGRMGRDALSAALAVQDRIQTQNQRLTD
ncbi:MAG: Gfo/Idh/MocA family oxidoreductase [Desulfobacterales bacterium]|nr:Gfo/Idh/MocA family oxidoreductase [Desulfobacterales bacterium]